MVPSDPIHHEPAEEKRVEYPSKAGGGADTDKMKWFVVGSLLIFFVLTNSVRAQDDDDMGKAGNERKLR